MWLAQNPGKLVVGSSHKMLMLPWLSFIVPMANWIVNSYNGTGKSYTAAQKLNIGDFANGSGSSLNPLGRSPPKHFANQIRDTAIDKFTQIGGTRTQTVTTELNLL